MNVIKLKDEENNITQDAKDKIKLLQNSSVVVFAGSAVSIWKPTGLASGMSVTKSFWDILFKDFDRSPQEKNFIDSLVWEFPFEHLFEVCPNKEKAKQFLIKTYNCSVANPVHKAIAAAFNDGRVSHIITTNFDRCFEGAFREFPSLNFTTVVEEKQALQNYSNTTSKIFFKVHGTAENTSDSLIFTLRDEGLLPEGKRLLLRNLMSEKICLFIGYSGLDFDLCPLIAKIPEISIIWIDIKKDPQSINSKNLLEQTNATYIKADMRELIPLWLGIDCTTENNAKEIAISDIKAVFSKEEILLWRIALLNNIGLPKVTHKAISEAKDKIDEREILLHKARALFYEGKYLAASNTFASLSKLHSKNGDSKLSSNVWLDTSDSYRAGGYYFRGWRSLFKGRYASPEYDQAKYFLKKSLLISNFLEGINSVKVFKILRVPLKKWLRRNLKLCAKLSINQGSLHDFQQVGLVAERHRIQFTEIIERDYYPPSISREGYKHLGYYHAEVMTFNDECLRTDFGKISDKEKKEFLQNFKNHIEYCELTGQNASLWKLLANNKKFLKNTKLGVFEEDEKLTFYFQSCQYSKLMRFQQARKFNVKS